MYDGNLLFVEAPGIRLKESGRRLGPARTNHPKISQLILAGIAERHFPGAHIRIVDMKASCPEGETMVKDVRYGTKTLNVYRVGADFAHLNGHIAWADTIVMTCNFTQEAGVIGDLIRHCKSVHPHARVLLGGSDAMIIRREVNRQSYFLSCGADYVASGDGEVTLPNLLEKRYAPSEAVAILHTLDHVPNPAFHFVDLAQYTESPEGPLPSSVPVPLMYIETSRGCRHSCSFCATPFTKRAFRYMSQARIENLLDRCEAAGIGTLLLSEDNILSRLDFPGGRDHVVRWFSCMRERGFRWEFSNGIEIGKLHSDGAMDRELIEVLFRYDGTVGCFRTYMPLDRVGTEQPAYRKLKPFDLEREIIGEIADVGMPIHNLGIIIGHPDESNASLALTEHRMLDLMTFIRSRKGVPYAIVFLHIPIPGTNDYRQFYQEGRFAYEIDVHPELFNFYTSVINGDTFSCHELTEIRQALALKLNGNKAMQVWEGKGVYDYGQALHA